MAKRSVSYTMGGNPRNRMSNVLAGDAQTGGRGAKRNPSVMRSGDYANTLSGYNPAGLGMPVTRMSAYGKPGRSKTKDQARVAPTPVQRASVPGGAGVMALNNVRLRPTATAPKATMNATVAAPIKARAKPTGTKDVVRTTTNMKTSPVRGGGLGVTTGKTTGSSATRMGTGGKTSVSASQRAQQNAFNKGGVAGPSRSGGGKTSGSSSSKSSSAGGSNTGRGDVGAGRRGGR